MDSDLKLEWIEQQLQLKGRLQLTDELPWQHARRTVADCPQAILPLDLQNGANSLLTAKKKKERQIEGLVTPAKCPLGADHCLRLVAGADLSFVKDSPDKACASLTVLRLPDLQPVYRVCRMVHVSHPYEPGFLSFREAPPVLELLEDLRASNPELAPQALLLDGNGTLHPRGFGLACHIGVLAGLPTVGVAKTFFHVDGLDQKTVKHLAVESGQREYYIKGDSGATQACAYLPSLSVTNPLYISCGHRISLPTSVWLAGLCCRHRVPEPTRLADIESREHLRQLGFNLSGENPPRIKPGKQKGRPQRKISPDNCVDSPHADM